MFDFRRFLAKESNSEDKSEDTAIGLSPPDPAVEPSTSSASSTSQLSQSLTDPLLRHRRELAYLAAARRMGQSNGHSDS